MSTLKQKDKQPKHDRDEPEFVDRDKWQRLAQSENSEEFFAAWLDLQCTQIDSVRTGILLAETQADKTFSPAAYWPTAAGVSEAIIEVARSSLDEAQALVIDLQKEYGSTLSVNADSVGVSFPVQLQGYKRKRDGRTGFQLCPKPVNKFNEVRPIAITHYSFS